MLLKTVGARGQLARRHIVQLTWCELTFADHGRASAAGGGGGSAREDGEIGGGRGGHVGVGVGVGCGRDGDLWEIGRGGGRLRTRDSKLELFEVEDLLLFLFTLVKRGVGGGIHCCDWWGRHVRGW